MSKKSPAGPKGPVVEKMATPGGVAEFFDFDPTPEGRARRAAEVEARSLLQLYRRHDNGAFFWRAFQELRRAGVPLPERMLKTLDKMAAGLLDARGKPKERLASIAKAVGMTAADGGGGPQGNAQADRVLVKRDIVQAVHQRAGLKRIDTAIYADVAKRFDGRWSRATGKRLTPRGVEDMYQGWIKAAKR